MPELARRGESRDRRTNLPPFDRTRFVGRAAELDALGRELQDGTALLTVVGPAGVGKTRLARRLATRLLPLYAGGVWFCELAAVRGRDSLVEAVAATLGIPFSRTADAPAQLRHAIAGHGPILMVLDNCEHLDAAATAELAVWLEAAPEAQFLVTSIVRLGVEGETCFELAPMRTDDAVALYQDRALKARGDLAPSDPATVETLVARLDHLPLAIELAAARAAVLSPKQLLARIDQRLDLLHGSRHGRHDSLAGAISWAWDLLPPGEREALAQCSVFRGGFSLEAAEAVVRPSPGAAGVLDLLEGLREKSLLRREEAPSDRFALLESVRDFAARELARMGCTAEVEARHRECYLRTAESLTSRLHGPDGVEAMRALRVERDNLVAAHRRSLQDGPEVSARLGLALAHLVARHGAPAFETELTDRVVADARAARIPELRVAALRARAAAHLKYGRAGPARADIEEGLGVARRIGASSLEGELLATSGRLRSFQGELDPARDELHRAVELHRTGGERHLEAQALNVLGAVEEAAGRLTESAAVFESSLQIFREVGDLRFQAILLLNLGVVRASQGRLEEARVLEEDALELLERAEDRDTAAAALVNLGDLLMVMGDLDAAERSLERALALSRALGHRRFEALALGNLGIAALERGSLRAARQRLQQSLSVFRSCDERRFRVVALSFYAAVEASLGLVEAAREDFAAARAAFEELGDPGNLASLSVLEGFLDLALARQAAERLDHEAAEPHLRAARRRLEPDLGGDTRATDVTVALRMLSRALSERDASGRAAAAPAGETPPSPDALAVAETMDWFEPPGGERIDISRRAALRLVLQGLVEQRLLAPGVGLSAERVFELGWPGERALPTAAANRVYAAIRTLRGLGLGDLLLRHDDGYLLSPGVALVRVRG